MQNRTLISWLLAAIIMVGVAMPALAQGTADSTTRAAVMAVLNKMADSYAKRDTVATLAAFSPSPGALMYGTGADEKRIGRAQFKMQLQRDWSQTESAAMSFGWTSVSASGNVAWLASDMTYSFKAGGKDATMPGRLTAVFMKHNDKWMIEQSHFSAPLAAQAEGQSWPEQKK